MRQTSTAVLMLLGAASAATQFAVVTPAITPTLANQGSYLGYSGGSGANGKKAIYRHVATNDNATTLVVAGADNKAGVTANGTVSCLKCMKGELTTSTKRTVWCSAGWNYEYTALAGANAYPITKNGAGSTPTAWNDAGDTNESTMVKGDQGACCYSSDVMETFAAIANNKADGASELKTDLLNKWTCPAKYTSPWKAAGKANTWNNPANTYKVAATPWWCSDGSYNMVKDNALYKFTTGATAGGNENATTWANATTFGDVANLVKNDYT